MSYKIERISALDDVNAKIVTRRQGRQTTFIGHDDEWRRWGDGRRVRGRLARRLEAEWAKWSWDNPLRRDLAEILKVSHFRLTDRIKEALAEYLRCHDVLVVTDPSAFARGLEAKEAAKRRMVRLLERLEEPGLTRRDRFIVLREALSQAWDEGWEVGFKASAREVCGMSETPYTGTPARRRSRS